MANGASCVYHLAQCYAVVPRVESRLMVPRRYVMVEWKCTARGASGGKGDWMGWCYVGWTYKVLLQDALDSERWDWCRFRVPGESPPRSRVWDTAEEAIAEGRKHYPEHCVRAARVRSDDGIEGE